MERIKFKQMKTVEINHKLKVSGPDLDGDIEIQMFNDGHQITGTFLNREQLELLIETVLNAEAELTLRREGK